MHSMTSLGGLEIAYDMAKDLNAASTQVQINDVKIAFKKQTISEPQHRAISQFEQPTLQLSQILQQIREGLIPWPK